MSATPSEPGSLTQARRLDEACNRFEAAWQAVTAAGDRPRVEDYLTGVSGAARHELLRELLLLDVHYRRLAGEAPSTADYGARFPDTDLSWLREAVSRTTWGGANGTTAVPEAGYEVLGELGRGGMGVVYRARDPRLGRDVALKVIRGSQHAGDEERVRFRREAQAVARLQHPNIVQVFEIGERDGQPFLALELVEGGSLAARLAGAPLPPAEAARVVEVIARAVQHAHERSIVHRDLKPGNVLLSEDGTPKVTDFGLAKRLGAESDHTQTGAVVGTPSYMAPEQARGEKAIGPGVDVYALGAILYECLTGRPPFKAATIYDTLVQVTGDEPVPPARLNALVPRDLETITLKCLQKSPADRYDSALSLADDLGRYLRQEPIRARPAPVREVVWKWVRRRPAVAALTAAVVATFLTGLALVTWQWQEAVAASREKDEALGEKDQALGVARERGERLAEQATELTKQTGLAQAAARAAGDRAKEAKRAQKEAEESLARADWSNYVSRIVYARREVDDNNFSRALDILSGCRRDMRNFEHRYLWSLAQKRVITIPTGGQTMAAALSPDGALLATGTRITLLKGGTAGELKLWDAASGRLLSALTGHTREVGALAFRADGRRLASGSLDQTVRIWDVERRVSVKTIPLVGPILSLAFSGDGRLLAVGGWKGLVRIFETETWTEKHKFQEHTLGILGLSFSPDGKRLAAASGQKDRYNGRVEPGVIWELQTGKPVAVLKGRETAMNTVAFSPNGLWLVSGSGTPDAYLWDARSGMYRGAFTGHAGKVDALAWSADSKLVVTGAWDNEVKVWDVGTRQVRNTFKGHTAAVSAISVSQKGDRVASGGDNTARVRGLNTETEGRILRDNSTFLHRVAFNPAGTRLARAGQDRKVKVYDAETGQVVLTLDHVGIVYDVAWSPDGKLLAAGSGPAGPGSVNRPGKARVWDASTGTERLTLGGHQGPVKCVAFSPDGKRLATGGGALRGTGELNVWDAQTGRHLCGASKVHQRIDRVAFTPDGKWLVAAESHGGVALWSAATATRGRLLSDYPGKGLNSLAVSPDGALVASSRGGDAITVWERATGQVVAVLSGHTDLVNDVAFSHDGLRLASASGIGDRTVRVWSVRTGDLLLTLVGHTNSVTSVAFSGDGRRLASGGNANQLRVWDADMGQGTFPLATAKQAGYSVALRGDGLALAVGGIKGELAIWDTEMGRAKVKMLGTKWMVNALAFSPDGERLVAGGGWVKGAELRLWDARRGVMLAEMTGHEKYVMDVAYRPDGRQFASASADGTARVWSGEGKLLHRLAAHTKAASCVAYSPDGRLLATGSYDGVIRLYRADTAKPVREVPVPKTALFSLAFSPDSKTLASGHGNNLVRLWDVATGERVRMLNTRAIAVRGLAWRPNSKHLVTAAADGVARLWDATTGEEVTTLLKQTGSFHAVSFDKSGRWLATGSAEQGATLSDLVTLLGERPAKR